VIGRTFEGLATEAITEKQNKLVERVLSKRHGLPHEEYIRLNGEWWGLEDAKNVLKEVVKKADV